MIGEAPESHQDRIDRETRQGDRSEAKARQKKLEEKYGQASTTVQDPNGNKHDVEGADCPDCDEGVIVVAPQHDSYPPWKESCTECGER